MKLLRCYIENFGTLQKYEMNFQDGITVIKAPNGFGKTTFAAFIRSMLYGLPRANKTDLDKDLRRKYMPWQGGAFGGNMEFELDGKCYRVERFFGDKPANDSFQLYELPSMLPCDTFTENLGVEIFGLDAESFERSAYMANLSVSGNLSTDSIRAKLSDLVEDTDDVNNYEKAVGSIRRMRASLIPYRGSGGEVNRASDRITELQNSISECSAVRGRLPGLYSEINALEKELYEKESRREELRSAVLNASEQKARNALAERKNDLVNRRNAVSAELDELFGKYPKGVPTEWQLNSVAEDMDKLAAFDELGSEVTAAELLEKKNAGKAAPKKSAKGGMYLPLMIIAGLIAAAGVAVALLTHVIAMGAAISGVGVLLGMVLYLTMGDTAKASKARSLDDDVENYLRSQAQQQENREQTAEECQAKIDDFFDKYAPTLDRDRKGLMKLRGDALRYGQLREDFTAATAELEGFRTEHPDVTEKSSDEPVDAEAMKQEYELCVKRAAELNTALGEKRREAELLRDKSAKLPELCDSLDYWKTFKAKGTEKCEVLDRTVEYLQLARERLAESYTEDIKDGFEKYLNCMMDSSDEHIFVGTDLSVMLERGGKARDLQYFSAGTADIVMLCMRLALIDALFEGEKPFIIMDDPFVNLDDEHIVKALELLNKLGESCQILYLVCNSSRDPGSQIQE